MRNITVYPITHAEKIATLKKLLERELADLNEQMVCGDMTCAILSEIIQDLEPPSVES